MGSPFRLLVMTMAMATSARASSPAAAVVVAVAPASTIAALPGFIFTLVPAAVPAVVMSMPTVITPFIVTTPVITVAKVTFALQRKDGVDGRALFGAEMAILQHADGIIQLCGFAGADQYGGHFLLAQHPGQRHLRQLLPALFRHRI